MTTMVAAKLRCVELEFSAVESNLEDLKCEHFKSYDGEFLVVNSILHLHRVVKGSYGALDSTLQVIRGLSPKVLELVEQDSSRNEPFFFGQFMEADSLNAMLPKYDTRRAIIEQFFFTEEIKDIVSYEGMARVQRHELVMGWKATSLSGVMQQLEQPQPVGVRWRPLQKPYVEAC